MRIVFDLDNTLADELGSSARPGIHTLLESLRAEGHILLLWTNSKRQRAESILRDHGLAAYFTSCTFREDYDPENLGHMKDIRRINGDFLVDDDPAEIRFVASIGRRGYQIPPYRKGREASESDYDDLRSALKGSESWWKRLFSWQY